MYFHGCRKMKTANAEKAKSNLANQPTPIPSELADVAYIDGASCAAAGAMSISQWHSHVKNGEAPQPAIRKTRFTRWKISEVRAWLIRLSDASVEDATASVKVIERAKSASLKAKESRQIKYGNTVALERTA